MGQRRAGLAGARAPRPRRRRHPAARQARARPPEDADVRHAPDRFRRRAARSPTGRCPTASTSHTARPCRRKRFAVYRNNVVVGLVEALRAPLSRDRAHRRRGILRRDGAALRHGSIRRARRSCTTYGDDFADFIAAFEPAPELPYLADVARLEAARTRAYHAADAAPLGRRRVSPRSIRSARRTAPDAASLAARSCARPIRSSRSGR